MQAKRLLLGGCAGLAVTLLPASSQLVQAQDQVALTGQISSDAEAAMEGVVVSAKKAGSIVTVSVISDAQGRYSFPSNRLGAGKYTLKIRAIGYDLNAPASADVADSIVIRSFARRVRGIASVGLKAIAFVNAMYR